MDVHHEDQSGTLMPIPYVTNPRPAAAASLIITVTEPMTRDDGSWDLSRFMYTDVQYISRTTLVESVSILKSTMRASWKIWMATMPEVHIWLSHPSFTMGSFMEDNAIRCVWDASGLFALSDNDVKTENLMEAVSKSEYARRINQCRLMRDT